MCVSSFLERHFCCAKVIACGRMIEREWGNPQRFPPHTPPSLRYAGVRTTKPVGDHKKERHPYGCLSFLEQHFCYAKVVACGRVTERARETRQRFSLHTFPSLRYAGVQTANPRTITKRKAAHSGGFTVSRPLAKIRGVHYNYNSVSVFVRSAGTAMFPAEICEDISEWSKEDKT